MSSFLDALNQLEQIPSNSDDTHPLNEAEDITHDKVAPEEYVKSTDADKISFIEKELLETIKQLDINIESINIYERQYQTDKFPRSIYEVKNMFLESKRKALRELFDIIAHQQKLEKDIKGDSFTEIIKT